MTMQYVEFYFYRKIFHCQVTFPESITFKILVLIRNNRWRRIKCFSSYSAVVTDVGLGLTYEMTVMRLSSTNLLRSSFSKVMKGKSIINIFPVVVWMDNSVNAQY